MSVVRVIYAADGTLTSIHKFTDDTVLSDKAFQGPIMVDLPTETYRSCKSHDAIVDAVRLRAKPSDVLVIDAKIKSQKDEEKAFLDSQLAIIQADIEAGILLEAIP